MRRMQRIVLLAAFVAAAPVLSGCANFDPESLDIFGLTEKKKLPGERKPVFPEGVPGVVQGVPPQYIKGNQPPADAAVIAPPVEEAKPEPAPAVKPKPKRKVAAKPKPAPVQPVTEQQQQPPQQPQQQQQPQQAQTPGAWPQGSTPPATGAATPWPAPPPAGTFSR